MRNIVVHFLIVIFVFYGIVTVADEHDSQDNTAKLSGLSGTVVDIEGNSAAEVPLTVLPLRKVNGRLEAQPGIQFRGRFMGAPNIFQQNLHDPQGNDGNNRLPKSIKTDSDGKFSFTDLPAGYVHVMITPNPDNPNNPITNKKIIAYQFGKVTIYPQDDRFGPENKFTFNLPAGEPVNNLKITVKQRLKIHAEVVSADGTPVKNSQISLNMKIKSEQMSGNYGMPTFTNVKGYFTHYMDEAGIYTVTIEYQGFTAGVSPFQLDEKVNAPENLLFKLNGNPIIVEPGKQLNQSNVVIDGIPNRGIKFPPGIDPGAKRILIQEQIEEQRKKQQEKVVEKSVWIVNPANGHAYKKIPCTDWHDAQQTAIEELAHLVSINNKAEQLWLQVIYGTTPLWIGLNDVEKEGVWQWDSGEPVSYTNWATHEVFHSNHTDAQKDFVAMTFHYGGWQAVAPDDGPGGRGHSPLWRITRHAILEKDGLISKKPVPDTTEQE